MYQAFCCVGTQQRIKLIAQHGGGIISHTWNKHALYSDTISKSWFRNAGVVTSSIPRKFTIAVHKAILPWATHKQQCAAAPEMPHTWYLAVFCYLMTIRPRFWHCEYDRKFSSDTVVVWNKEWTPHLRFHISYLYPEVHGRTQIRCLFSSCESYIKINRLV